MNFQLVFYKRMLWQWCWWKSLMLMEGWTPSIQTDVMEATEDSVSDGFLCSLHEARSGIGQDVQGRIQGPPQTFDYHNGCHDRGEVGINTNLEGRKESKWKHYFLFRSIQDKQSCLVASSKPPYSRWSTWLIAIHLPLGRGIGLIKKTWGITVVWGKDGGK